MGGSRLRLYAPFLALAVVQALIITVAPSTSRSGPDVAFDPGGPAATEAGEPDHQEEWELVLEDEEPDGAAFESVDDVEDRAAGEGAGGTAATPAGGGSPGIADDGPGGDDGSSEDDGSSQDDGSVGGGGQEGDAPAPADPSADDPGGSATAARGGGTDGPTGDASHCTANGRQHGVTYHAPPCQPTWPDGADNGGATYRGVTEDTVRIVLFREIKNEHVATLLNQEGLARTMAQEEAFLDAAEEFLNEHYEFYGREVDLILHAAQRCPETPPDIPACRWEAQHIVDTYEPFMVLWPVPLYADVFDVFVRNQVIAVGGWHFDARYFNERRPFRYDLFMDGTRSAELLGEYYCKKLANQNASNSGRMIHPTIGARDQVPRRLGIITPEGDAFTGPAQRLAQIVADCDEEAPVIQRYPSDIEQAQRNANANIEAMIEGKVTTVVCVCDPIAPINRTIAASRQNYYPEHLLPGSGLLDYDKLGRLYEPSQWTHAFGPGHLQVYPPFSETDATRMWRATGRSGEPCQGCNLPGSYYLLAGSMVQNAGPNLNPQTVERGMVQAGASGGWEQTGGRADIVMLRFGRNDYTGIADAREVYWDSSARSTLDGRPGAYVALDRGRRFTHGELTSQFNVPVKPQ